MGPGHGDLVSVGTCATIALAVRARRARFDSEAEKTRLRAHKLVLYLARERTRGLQGQPPAQYEHEVVTGDGDVDTLLQATR